MLAWKRKRQRKTSKSPSQTVKKNSCLTCFFSFKKHLLRGNADVQVEACFQDHLYFCVTCTLPLLNFRCQKNSFSTPKRLTHVTLFRKHLFIENHHNQSLPEKKCHKGWFWCLAQGCRDVTRCFNSLSTFLKCLFCELKTIPNRILKEKML